MADEPTSRPGNQEELDAARARVVNALPDEEFHRLFGRWEPWSPREVAAHFAAAPFLWWIVGGWSLDQAVPPRREHEDTDVAVLADDLPAVRHWLREFHLWETRGATLRPLMPGLPMTPEGEQLWVRRDAASPWALDLLLTPTDGDRWLYKRDHALELPLDEIVIVGSDDVPYQRPEVSLLFKARLRRPKDEEDLTAVLPQLSDEARSWLGDALERTEGEHPWIRRLSD